MSQHIMQHRSCVVSRASRRSLRVSRLRMSRLRMSHAFVALARNVRIRRFSFSSVLGQGRLTLFGPVLDAPKLLIQGIQALVGAPDPEI